MVEYMTEQKRVLLDFLRNNCENSYTIDELTDKIKSSGGAKIPAKSTVYRLITRLVEEGTVKRFIKDNSRSFAYQIITDEECHNHLHLKCMECGKLIHLEESVSDELMNKVKLIKDFSIDEDQTVLFGKCSGCKIGGAK